MKRLIQIEWMKVSGYRTFWVFLILYVLLVFLVYFILGKMLDITKGQVPFDLSGVYRFPDVWYFISYVSSWCAPILALLMINLVTNEFSFRTLRQQIIDGMSRAEVLTAKLSLSGVLSIAAAAVALIAGLGIGLIKGGQGFAPGITSQLDYLLRVAWVCFGMMSAGILISLIVKHSALSILVFLVIYWMIEPIAGRQFLPDLYAYFPLNSLDEFIASPFSETGSLPSFKTVQTSPSVLIAGIIWPLLFNLASFQLIKSKDL